MSIMDVRPANFSQIGDGLNLHLRGQTVGISLFLRRSIYPLARSQTVSKRVGLTDFAENSGRLGKTEVSRTRSPEITPERGCC